MRKQTRNTEMAVSPVILQATSKHTASVSISISVFETKNRNLLVDTAASIQLPCVILWDVTNFEVLIQTENNIAKSDGLNTSFFSITVMREID